jgi:hypothetical protein
MSVVDGIYHAAVFDVVDGEFYPTKRLPPAGYGHFLLEYHWSFRDPVRQGSHVGDRFEGAAL